MKTTKYTFRISPLPFLFCLFTFAFFTTTFGQLEVKDSDDNVLVKVNDYGTAGTLTISPFIGIGPSLPINNYMLYNIEGTLYWNGSALGTSNSAAGWMRPIPGGKIYPTDLADNVGIGTNNPLSKLSVGGDGIAAATIYGETISGRSAQGSATSGTGVLGESISGAGVLGSTTTGYAVYGQVSNPSGYAGYFEGRGYFTENVGIGQTSPTYKLHVKDNLSNNFVAKIENTNGSVDSDGLAILLNKTWPTTTNHFIRFQESGGGGIGSISGNGLGGIAYTTTSDARLKTKIQDYSNALNVLSRIGIKKYERISNPGIEEIGVIAQELQKVYPQAVSGSPDSDVKTDPMMVDYSKLTPLLVKGMQEQEQKISSQEVRIKELEERLAKLESLLDGKRFTTVNK
jgi:hypothetical protein